MVTLLVCHVAYGTRPTLCEILSCSLLHNRVRDTSIIVAVDEPPEEGLEQPLRLEKLANEVRLLQGPGQLSCDTALPKGLGRLSMQRNLSWYALRCTGQCIYL